VICFFSIFGQVYQPAACEGQAVTLEADQCHLRQKLCYTNQMQYIVLFAVFVCVLLFVVSLYYETAAKQPYCVNCRGIDYDYSDRFRDDPFW